MVERAVKIQISRMHTEIGRGDLKPAREGISWKCGEGVKIDLTADVVVEDAVEISDDVRIFTHRHNWRKSRGDRKDIQEVTAHALYIGRDVFIGTAAMLVGVEEIGEGAVIGAGAVVRKRKVGAFEIWAGNPAKCEGIRGDDRRRESKGAVFCEWHEALKADGRIVAQKSEGGK